MLVMVAAVATAGLPALGGTARIERVSLRTNGHQANDAAYNARISADGRFVVWSTNATNLVANDLNSVTDVFVHDRETGKTRRVSVSSDEVEGNGISGEYAVAISNDGRFVAFESTATNLVPNDTNAHEDMFVRDLVRGTTERVSLRSNGAQANDSSYESVELSADGRYVAFGSLATNLVKGDTNGVADVFVHDRLTGKTRRVSVRSNGVEGNGDSGRYALAISADGQVVAFDSEATNLVGGDTNGYADTFVHDRTTGRTERVSVRSNGNEGNGEAFEQAALSGAGRYVAFSSAASDLVAGDTNASIDVFVHDRETGKTRRVSVSTAGTEGNGDSGFGGGGSAALLGLSGGGRYVLFSSEASNLVGNDTNAVADAFLFDTETGKIRRVSMRPNGTQGNGESGVYGMALTPSARFATFVSAATNLVSGDTNGHADAFVTGPLR
jgi:hypothetical protein